MEDDLVRVDVSVVAGGNAVDEVFRSALARELDCLRKDLALPANVEVTVVLSPELKSGECDVSIAGRRVGRQRPAVDGPSERHAHAIATMIHANRDALVTQDVVERLWGMWGRDEDPPPASFGTVLRQLARYRLRADRAARFALAWQETDPADLLEAALWDVSRRIMIELHPETFAALAPGLSAGDLFPMMIDGLFYELGVRTGECVPTANGEIPRDRVSIRINDVRTPAEPIIGTEEVLVNDVVHRLASLNIKARRAFNPANGNECAIVALADKDACEQSGLTTWNAAAYVVLVVAAAIRSAAPALVSEDIVAEDLAQFRLAFSRLGEALERAIGVRRFAWMLRALLHEEISIRNFPLIVDSVLRVPPTCTVSDKYIVFTSTWSSIRARVALVDPTEDADAIEMSEYIRMSLKRYISHKYTRGFSTLMVYLLDPQIEDMVRDRDSLDADQTSKILDAVFEEVRTMPPTSQQPVILTTAHIRYGLRRLLRTEFPRLHVLSYQELSPEMNIQPIARISLQ